MVAQLFLYQQQAVVLGGSLAAHGGARLDLPRADADGEVGYRRVFGFARTVAYHRSPAGVFGHADGVERLAHRANLVELDQDGVGRAALYPAPNQLRVGGVDVVPDELRARAEPPRHHVPRIPVVLRQAVLYRDDRVVAYPGVVNVHHVLCVVRCFVLGKGVSPRAAAELGGGDVQGDEALLSGDVSGVLYRLDDQLDRLPVGSDGRGEAAFVADVRAERAVSQTVHERVIDLHARLQRAPERVESERQDHEFLKVGGVLGVPPAVDDVEHGDGQDERLAVVEMAVERHAAAFGRGAGDGERRAQDGVRAETGLVFGAVELVQQRVYGALVVRRLAAERGGDLLADVADGVQDAAPAKAHRIAVPQLRRLVRAGGRAGRHKRPSRRAVIQRDVDLDGRVAARVENFARSDVGDFAHGAAISLADFRAEYSSDSDSIIWTTGSPTETCALNSAPPFGLAPLSTTVS